MKKYYVFEQDVFEKYASKKRFMHATAESSNFMYEFSGNFRI